MTKRKTPFILAFVLAASLFACAVAHSAGSEKYSEPGLFVPRGIRLMVFAPHPDDETVAAGGLIQRVLHTGGQVRVVFVTNGDGFTDGVRLEVTTRPTLSTDYIAYGIRRQAEAMRALAELGLGSRDALFLGFPDGGIDDLWTGHWSASHPYQSPYTRLNRPRNAPIHGRLVRYTGADLKALLVKAIRDFQPDWVLIPDPRDVHPDHSMTGVFVLDALESLERAKSKTILDTEVYTYLVHFPGYPGRKDWVGKIQKTGVTGCPAGGRCRIPSEWMSLPLSADETLRKEAALSAHRTQMETMSSFLRQFLRPYEIFGKLLPLPALDVPCNRASLAGEHKG